MDYTKTNTVVLEWLESTVMLLRAEAMALGIFKTGAFANSLTYKFKIVSSGGKASWHKAGDSPDMNSGLITVVGFSFRRHGIYVHYGLAGKGGQVKTTEKHWYTNVMKVQLEVLQQLHASKLSEDISDRLFNQLTVGLIYE